MRLQDNKTMRMSVGGWGLRVKEEGLRFNEQGGGVKVFLRRKVKGDWRGVGVCGGRSF